MELIIHNFCLCCRYCSLSDARRWAWNNTHVTKRIAKEQRISHPKEKTKKSRKTGRVRKWLQKPMSLTDKLSNLHLLLRVPSFSRLPLQVRFFSKEVYQKWRSWNERADGSIRDGIKVLLDLREPGQIINDSELLMSPHAKGKRKREAMGKGGIEGLDVGYSNLKNHIEKSIFFLADYETLKCAVCAEKLGPRTAVALVWYVFSESIFPLCLESVCSLDMLSGSRNSLNCAMLTSKSSSSPQENCRTASHVTCLATKFIKDEGAGSAITPISGRCPGCKEELQWIDLIKESSLRIRGEKEVTKITIKPKERKTKVSKMKDAVAPQPEAHLFDEGDEADPDEDSVAAEMRAMDAADDSLPDDWQYQIEVNNGMVSVLSGHSAVSDGVEAAIPTKRSSSAPKLPAVIEDSELDDTDFRDSARILISTRYICHLFPWYNRCERLDHFRLLHHVFYSPYDVLFDLFNASRCFNDLYVQAITGTHEFIK